ncbi:MAG: 30S ribosomal protein S20 [bacterium]
MANHKSAVKRIRQNEKRRLINRTYRSNLRSNIKNVLLAINKNDKEGAKDLLSNTLKTIDKAASKKIIHKRNAARKKSRLTKKINAIISA